MNFMAAKKHRLLKVVICIVAAVVVCGAGYYAGMQSQTDSVMNALPRVAHDKQAEEDAQKAAEATEGTESNATQEATQVPESVFIGKTNISAAGEGTWTTVDSCNYDITGDGVNDSVTLYSSAESDDQGILWDDTQKWILEVGDGVSGYYTLINTDVTNGGIYYEVDETDTGCAIMVYMTSGSGTEIREYIFGKAGFTEKVIRESKGSNTVHSSIPWYK